MEKRNISGLIKELRKASGLKQSHIAERLNVERSGISKIESGVPALSPEVINKIASIFKINPDFIDGRTDNAFLPESFQVSVSFAPTDYPWANHPIYLWSCAP